MAERDNGCLVLQTGGLGECGGGNLREITKIKRQIPDPGPSYPLGRQVSFPFGSLPFVLTQFNLFSLSFPTLI